MKISRRKLTNRSTSVALILLSLCVIWIGAGRAQERGKAASSEALTQLYAGAKREGTVTIWGPTDAIIYQKMQTVLDKQYPGIKIEHFESIPEPLVQRIIAESQAGKAASVDIIQSGSLRAVRPLIDRDMLVVYPGWEKDFGLDAVYAGGRFVGAYNLTLPISYNSKAVSAKEAPKNWEELLEPKWKGRKLIIEARLVPFAMLGTEWGKAKVTDMVKKLLAQEPIIVQGGTTVANALAGGQVSIAVGTYAYTIERLKKAGATVDWIPVAPLPVLTSAVGVLKTAPHPNAARFFAGWMGTTEGQQVRYETSGQANEVGKNAIGAVAERIRTARPAIILETDKNFSTILETQRELGKLLGALR